jgi:hypothetical protein
MLLGEAALAEVLAGTPLAGRQTTTLPVPETLQTVLAIEIAPDEVWTTWSVARGLVEVTGRWPVAMTVWGSSGGWAKAFAQEDLFARSAFDGEPDKPADDSPMGFIAEAQDVDLNALLKQLEEEDAEDEDDEPHEGEPPEDDAEVHTGHIDWFDPEDQPTALMLMPTTRPWETLAYHPWYAAEGVGSAAVIALVERWHARYQAELVAHWGTMLQFVVGRRPADLEEARALAREQILFAPCTTLLSGVTLDEHARALLEVDRWFVHERP